MCENKTKRGKRLIQTSKTIRINWKKKKRPEYIRHLAKFCKCHSVIIDRSQICVINLRTSPLKWYQLQLCKKDTTTGDTWNVVEAITRRCGVGGGGSYMLPYFEHNRILLTVDSRYRIISEGHLYSLAAGSCLWKCMWMCDNDGLTLPSPLVIIRTNRHDKKTHKLKNSLASYFHRSVDNFKGSYFGVCTLYIHLLPVGR